MLAAVLNGCRTGSDPSSHSSQGYAHYAGASVKVPVSAAFGPDGRLWRVVSTDDRIYVDYSIDHGKSFSVPVAINQERIPIRAHSEFRSQITVDSAGRIYVAYPAYGAQPWTTYLSVSKDNGTHFSTPELLSDQAAVANSFLTVLSLDRDDRLYAFWHDERESASEESGNSIYYSIRGSDGTMLESNRRLVDQVCSCCRLALDIDPEGRPVLMFRNIYPRSVRDHAVAKLDATQDRWKQIRVSEDDWRIEACPTHGPALSIGSDGRYHLAWFTQGRARQGLFYANSSNQGQHFSEPMAVGGMRNKLPGHPDVISLGPRVVLAWSEFDGAKTQIMMVQSKDRGTSWPPARPIAESHSDSDYPFLLTDGRKIFLSWNSLAEGYRLVPIE